jgi:predicted transcriptional regulator
MDVEEQRAHLLRASTMRLGLDGYARILAGLRKSGMSTAQVVEAHKINHNTATKLLRYMHRMGLIHRDAWFRPIPKSRLVPTWFIGKDGDVSMPEAEVPAHRPPNSTMILFATAIQVLQDAPTTITELAAELALHKETAARIVQILRDNGLSRIAGWDRAINGMPVARHGYLTLRDATRPARPPITPEDRRRWRQTVNAKKQHLQMIAATAGARAIAKAAATGPGHA